MYDTFWVPRVKQSSVRSHFNVQMLFIVIVSSNKFKFCTNIRRKVPRLGVFDEYAAYTVLDGGQRVQGPLLNCSWTLLWPEGYGTRGATILDRWFYGMADWFVQYVTDSHKHEPLEYKQHRHVTAYGRFGGSPGVCWRSMCEMLC